MVLIRHVMRSLPLLAAVLGDSYGVDVQIGGNVAHTDGKTICLPALPLESDATRLALARGLLDHEAAHIRETDFEALRHWPSTAFSRHLWNSLEDWRVENKLADIFPGCRQNFRWLIERYFTGTADRAGDTNPALSILNAVLLTVRAWDAPGVQANRDMEIQEVNQAYPGLWPQIQVVLEKARALCRSTQDAIRFAEEIVAVIRDGSLQPSGNGSREEPGDAEPSEAGSGVPQTEEAEQRETEPPGEQAGGHGEATPEGAADSAGSAEPENVPGTAKRRLEEALLADATADWPQHLGEWLSQALTECPALPQDQGLAVAKRGFKPARPLEASDKDACSQASVALRTRLFRLLQSSRLVRSLPGRRGKPDPKRLHALALREPRVFLRHERKPGVNTAVHILLDSSGSMSGGSLKLAVLACYAVASALEKIKGVNVAVSAFPAGSCNDGVTVAPLIEHGEKVHANLDIQAEGYTPLAQALWWVLQRMVVLPEDRKIVLILSDGEPDSPVAAQKAIEMAQEAGFEVYGVGIQSMAILALLPRSSVSINSMSELVSIMFYMLQKALLKRG